MFFSKSKTYFPTRREIYFTRLTSLQNKREVNECYLKMLAWGKVWGWQSLQTKSQALCRGGIRCFQVFLENAPQPPFFPGEHCCFTFRKKVPGSILLVLFCVEFECFFRVLSGCKYIHLTCQDIVGDYIDLRCRCFFSWHLQWLQLHLCECVREVCVLWRRRDLPRASPLTHCFYLNFKPNVVVDK